MKIIVHHYFDLHAFDKSIICNYKTQITISFILIVLYNY